MKKFTLTTLLMLLFAFVAGAENFPQKERAGTTIQRKETGHQRMMQPRQQAPEQYPDIFGWLRYDERNQDEYGICKFNAYTPETIDVLHVFLTTLPLRQELLPTENTMSISILPATV